MKKAIVVGASSGIGRELAKILADNQYEVGIAARRIQMLNELRDETRIDFIIQQIDVSEPDTAMKTLETLIEKMNGVELIVLSAGTGHINDELKWEPEYETLKTNVIGFCSLANVSMRHFIEKRSGHLVGISSLAALRGCGSAPAYNASKAFELNYMEGLRIKVRKLGLSITITDIRPGFVDTAMAKGEGIFWSAPPSKAAMQIYQAIERKLPHAYVTRRWRMIAWLLKLMPGWLYERL